MSVTSFDDTPTSNERNLRDASERVRERLEHRDGGTHPDELGSKTAAPGNHHVCRERPRGHANDGIDKMSAPCRDRGPGGRLDIEDGPGDVEGNPDRQKVVNGSERDGIPLMSDRNERVVETDASNLETGPGGHGRKRVKDSQTRHIDGESVGSNGR